MQLQPSTHLQGDKYRIIRTLGNGGFGITYLAEHELAGRNVCIKEFFPKDFYNRDENSCNISLGSKGCVEMMDAYMQKFMKEAKTIARLDHPNIIHIHDVFAENNTAYYVMEYIDGESLNDLVKRRGALSEAEAIKYIRSVAEAIGYIHERKIMHLDIKPANVMLRKEDGRAIVIDFGLSKQYDAEGNQTSSTPVGISAGYAPMEQYQQGGVREFSPETDIYSLGATLYYLVTGKVPPQAVNIADEGLPTLPSNLSIGVCNAIERSMEIQRKRRPHTIKEFLALLEDNSNIAAPIPTPIPAPTPVPAMEETVIGVQTVNEETVISTPTPSQPKYANSSKVTICGYIELFAVNPDIKVYKGGEIVARVARKSKVEINLSEPCELKFSGNMRSARCYVKPGDYILLSFNRVTGGLSATLTTKDNLATDMNVKKSKDRSRIVWIIIICIIILLISQ